LRRIDHCFIFRDVPGEEYLVHPEGGGCIHTLCGAVHTSAQVDRIDREDGWIDGWIYGWIDGYGMWNVTPITIITKTLSTSRPSPPQHSSTLLPLYHSTESKSVNSYGLEHIKDLIRCSFTATIGYLGWDYYEFIYHHYAYSWLYHHLLHFIQSQLIHTHIAIHLLMFIPHINCSCINLNISMIWSPL